MNISRKIFIQESEGYVKRILKENNVWVEQEAALAVAVLAAEVTLPVVAVADTAVLPETRAVPAVVTEPAVAVVHL